MASLYRPFRLLPPLQSACFQPLGLGACAALQSRLLHSTPILAVRKPSKAIVKPVNASATTRKKQSKDAVKEKLVDIPFKTHPPTDTTTTTTTTTPAKPVSYASAIREAAIPPLPSTSAPHQSHPEQPALSPAIKPTLGYQPGGRDGVQAFLRKFADAESPTLIYEATKARSYVVWCAAASIFLAWIALTQYKYYLSDLAHNHPGTAYICLFTAFIWTTISIYAASGVTNVIKRIYALPSPTGRPVLRIEPLRIVYGKYPKPFEVRIGDAYTDRPFKKQMDLFEAMKPVRRNPGVLDRFFGTVGTMWSSNIKMCSRSTSFAQLRIRGGNYWRVDLRDCAAHDGGKTLDTLVLPDVQEASWIIRLFRRH